MSERPVQAKLPGGKESMVSGIVPVIFALLYARQPEVNLGVLCVCQGEKSAELELASNSMETLALCFREVLPPNSITTFPAFPKLSALTYTCDNSFNSLFNELPSLESLRIGGKLMGGTCKVR